MQAGELVVARISGGLSIGRCLAVEDGRARIAIGRNREARIPVERIALATGLALASEDSVEQFKQRASELASAIDLAEVWEVVCDEPSPLSLDDLAELYWGRSHDAAHKVALLTHLEQEPLYFEREDSSYLPRSREHVQAEVTRRQREAENARSAQELAEHLAEGHLPAGINSHQATLLEHLRGYAVHGDNYTRSSLARGLLDRVNTGSRDLQRRAFELLVRVGRMSEDEPLEIEQSGIPDKFSPEALEEAASIDLDSLLAQRQTARGLSSPRRDLTELRVVTIDDAGTQDRDDALSLEREGPDSQGQPVYRIGIHIADAGALILPGSALDREADRRMATLYTPERRITMLPPEIANHAGSLEQGQRRLALSLLCRITGSGDILDWDVAPSVVQSRAALSYEEVDSAIADPGHPYHEMLSALDSVARSLKRKREEAGAVSLDRPEMIIKALESGEVSVRVIPRSTPSRRLVTELMVLCNALLAEFCRREGIPAAYRSQATPDLGDVAGVPEGPLRWYMVMRRLAPADLSTTPAPHGSLGVPAYIQVSSPLRRYPDLVMQRQISHYLSTGEPLYSPEEIASVAQRADVQLRELSKIEDARERYWFLKYLKQTYLAGDRPAMFQAVVLENEPRRTAQLELVDYPFRVRTNLPPTATPGDVVTLRLHGVDPWRRSAQFIHER